MACRFHRRWEGCPWANYYAGRSGILQVDATEGRGESGAHKLVGDADAVGDLLLCRGAPWEEKQKQLTETIYALFVGFS